MRVARGLVLPKDVFPELTRLNVAYQRGFVWRKKPENDWFLPLAVLALPSRIGTASKRNHCG